MDESGPGQNQDSEAQPGNPTWPIGTQVQEAWCGPSCVQLEDTGTLIQRIHVMNGSLGCAVTVPS